MKALRRIQTRSSFPNPSSSPLFSSSPSSSPWTHLRSAIVLVSSSSPSSCSSSSDPSVSFISISHCLFLDDPNISISWACVSVISEILFILFRNGSFEKNQFSRPVKSVCLLLQDIGFDLFYFCPNRPT